MSQILSQNVHRTLKEISSHAKQLTETHSNTIADQQSTYEEYDKNTLLNNAVGGDEFLYIANNQGGRLLALDSKAQKSMHRLNDPHAQYFHIVLSDVNYGLIEEISQELAKGLALRDTNKPNKNQHQVTFYDKLDAILGLPSYDSLINSRMGQEFQPKAEEKSIARISLVTPNKVALEVLRLGENSPQNASRGKVQSENVYYSRVSSEVAEQLKVENICIRINGTQNGFADISKVPEQEFTRLQRELRRDEVKESLANKDETLQSMEI